MRMGATFAARAGGGVNSQHVHFVQHCFFIAKCNCGVEENVS